MTPAFEYLIRKELIKTWFELPWSLYLTEYSTGEKLVVTIEEEFQQSDHYSVKHWQISKCLAENYLPNIQENRVKKDKIFSNPNVILDNYQIFNWKDKSFNIKLNSNGRAASLETYLLHLEDTLNISYNFDLRKNWLWNIFVKIYTPNLRSPYNYIDLFSTTQNCSVLKQTIDECEKQRFYIQKNMKKYWKLWNLWQKHMLLQPGELVFLKEYRQR